MSINEKLAVEVMGWTPKDSWFGIVWFDANGRESLESYYGPEGDCFPGDWNPIKDLNQLKMCYEAAEKVQEYELQFRYRFRDHLQDRLHDHMGFDFVDAEIASAMINYPEVFAQAILDTRQAILKAKGVS